MNEQIRMQQMQADAAMRNQVPWYMRPPGSNEQPAPYSQPSQPYQRQMPFQQQFGFSQSPMPNPVFGGLGAIMAMRGLGGGYGQPTGRFGGKGGRGFNAPQASPFDAAMARGLGGFFR
jgi:hypothetical protein